MKLAKWIYYSISSRIILLLVFSKKLLVIHVITIQKYVLQMIFINNIRWTNISFGLRTQLIRRNISNTSHLKVRFLSITKLIANSYWIFAPKLCCKCAGQNGPIWIYEQKFDRLIHYLKTNIVQSIEFLPTNMERLLISRENMMSMKIYKEVITHNNCKDYSVSYLLNRPYSILFPKEICTYIKFGSSWHWLENG